MAAAAAPRISDRAVDWRTLGVDNTIGGINELLNNFGHSVVQQCVATFNEGKIPSHQVNAISYSRSRLVPCVTGAGPVSSPALHECVKKTYACTFPMKITFGPNTNSAREFVFKFDVPIPVKSALCRANMATHAPGLPERIAYDADIGGYFVIKGLRYIIVNQLTRARDDVTVTKVRTMSAPIQLPRALKHAKSESFTLKLSGPTSTMQWDAIIVHQAHATSFVKVVGIHKNSKYPLVALLRHLDITATDLQQMMASYAPDPADAAAAAAAEGDVDVDMEDVDAPPSKVASTIDLIYEGAGAASAVDVLSHLDDDQRRKTVMHMVKRLLLVMHGGMPPDTAELVKHRRILTAADMYRSLLESAFMRFLRVCAKKSNSVDARFVRGFTEHIELAIMSGEWTHNNMKGATTMMDTTNSLAMLSNLNRITSQLTQSEGGSNIIQQRLIFPDYIGRICFVEVPTGEHAGLVRQMALGARVTSSIVAPAINALAKTWVAANCLAEGEAGEAGDASVWLDGRIQPYTVSSRAEDIRRLVASFREWRACENFQYCAPRASIEWVAAAKELHIRTDGGRLVRQLRSLAPGADGRIEWIDAAEEFTMARVAMSTETVAEHQGAEYQEICEDLLLGVTAAVQPFINHSQGPRIVYQCSQSKQAAAGIPYDVRRNMRPDKNYYLANPQCPLVQTFAAVGISDALRVPIHHNGQMVMTAVISFEGYGQEDSILMKRSAIDRGMFLAVSHSTHSGELELEPRNIALARKNPAAHLIQADGLPLVGSSSKAASPTLIVCPDGTPNEVFMTGQVQSRNAPKITVNHVQRPIKNCTSHASVSVHRIMSPSIGDKFVTKGQKATVGRIVADEDMPVNCRGESPDVIINAHSIPSRMTVGLLIEALYNKRISIQGGDKLVMSAFSTGTQVPTSPHCKEVMIDGRTGRQFVADIFLAPLFWQRLEHVASEKAIVRGISGSIDAITKQPARGRKAAGGVTHSPMDNWCVLAHNAMRHLREVNLVDPYHIRYDPVTGCIDPTSSFFKEGPYGLQLLMHELMCLRILPRFI